MKFVIQASYKGPPLAFIDAASADHAATIYARATQPDGQRRSALRLGPAHYRKRGMFCPVSWTNGQLIYYRKQAFIATRDSLYRKTLINLINRQLDKQNKPHTRRRQ